MIRGDCIDLPFIIKKTTGEIVDGSLYDEVEVQFNLENISSSLKFLKSLGQVRWEEDKQQFIVSLSEEDTFKLNDGNVDMQVRLMDEGKIKATCIISVKVGRVLSNKRLNV